MHSRGLLFGVVVTIILFMFATWLTCLAHPSPLPHEADGSGRQVRQAGSQAGRQAGRQAGGHIDMQTDKRTDGQAAGQTSAPMLKKMMNGITKGSVSFSLPAFFMTFAKTMQSPTLAYVHACI